jgi:hypothetical protein
VARDGEGEQPVWKSQEATHTQRGLVRLLERRLLIALGDEGEGEGVGIGGGMGLRGRSMGVLAAGAIFKSSGGGADSSFAYRDVRGESGVSGEEGWEGEEKGGARGAGATVGHLCLLQESAVLQALLECTGSVLSVCCLLSAVCCLLSALVPSPPCMHALAATPPVTM